jgi:hypothetical protein
MKWFWLVLTGVLTLAIFSSRDFSSRYEQPIIGDAKGYYAYLPAIFIYQDANYAFIDQMEASYYPTDLSHAKDFKVKQKNGRFVNKCFPGLSLLYLPFFALGAFISFVFGFPIDGYSMPFQICFSFAHIFYFILGLIQLSHVFRKFELSKGKQVLIFSLFTFGTNLWFYLVHDHSVAHIFIFFLVCVFIRIFFNWLENKSAKWIGWMCVLLTLMVIIRPTNLLVVLFLPLLLFIRGENWRTLIEFKQAFHFRVIPYFLLCLLLVSIPLFLWKWQSGFWLVYSYGKEGFDFSNPQIWNYLFSFQKGWLLWTPILLFLSVLFVWKRIENLKLILALILPFAVLVYVFSSWWCWTFGAGMGQRAVIDYYPFLVLIFGLMLVEIRKPIVLFLFSSPFLFLNVVQAFQFRENILTGGMTNRADYWEHFLQIKKDAPQVIIPSEWKLLHATHSKKRIHLNENKHFTPGVLVPLTSDNLKVFVEISASGKHKSNNYTLVLTDSSGSNYQSYYLGEVIYSKARQLHYLFDVPSQGVYRCYVWNGDSSDEFHLYEMQVRVYQVEKVE